MYKYEIPTKRTASTRLTPHPRIDYPNNCDYKLKFCLKVYDTGPLCGRTMFYRYRDFKNMCMMDFLNCIAKYEIWQLIHMGACINLQPLPVYVHYREYYNHDYFLDDNYLLHER